MKTRHFTCQFCGRAYVTESRFLQHRCKQMQRDEEFRTPKGQTAWSYYKEWMRLQRRRVLESNAFLRSSFYNAFMRFTTFCIRVNLPNPKTFIRLMVEKNFDPTMWTNDDVYVSYLEYLDKKEHPLVHAKLTINTITNVTNKQDCNIGEFFDVVTPNEVISLLRERQLSPWILLNSSKFMHFFANRVSHEERIIIESIIRPKYWIKRFSENTQTVATMKRFVSEMEI